MSAIAVGLLVLAGFTALMAWIRLWADRIVESKSAVGACFAFVMGAGVPLGLVIATAYALGFFP